MTLPFENDTHEVERKIAHQSLAANIIFTQYQKKFLTKYSVVEQLKTVEQEAWKCPLKT